MNIRRIIIASIMATVSFVAAAQTDAHKAAAEAAKTLTEAPKTEEKVKKPTHWKSSLKTNINFGQTSLTNWAAGGDNTVSLAAYVDANANYAKNQLYWNNRLQLDYGFLYASSKPILQKNTDRIYLESKWGLKIPKAKNLSFTVKYDFKSQFTTGYNYLTPKITEEDYEKDEAGNLPALDDLPRKDQISLWKKSRQPKSGLLSPAYTNLAVGIDVAPAKWLTLNIAPLTGSVVIVRDLDFRKNYGMQLKDRYKELDKLPQAEQDRYNEDMASNDPALIGQYYKGARFELGAQLTADARVNINNNFSYSSQLKLFSNYLDKPLNMRVNWDNRFDWKLAKYFSLTVTTNLIYDDKVMIFSEKDGQTKQRVQFKESLAFGFTWTIAK
jgi:hypothetical protein